MISLSISKFVSIKNGESIKNDEIKQNHSTISLLKIILLLSITDLAFSIDSITAAVAISDQFLLVISGAIIGVIALRFTSGLFIQWLELYTNLEKAGYVAVGLIGIKLLIQVVFFGFNVPEYLFFLIMLFLFLWGFSEKNINFVN